jgi:acyl carrier protein
MSQNKPSLEAEIRKFITENMLFSADGFNYGDNDSLLDAGIVDSIGVMELVTFVDKTYHLTVPPEDISPDNFDSINRLANYIRRRQEGGKA